jgi:hypothetical protein
MEKFAAVCEIALGPYKETCRHFQDEICWNARTTISVSLLSLKLWEIYVFVGLDVPTTVAVKRYDTVGIFFRKIY